MKILHVLPNLDPSAGGLPSVAIRLAAAQARLGHEVGIACYRAADAQDRIAAEVAAVPAFDRVRLEYLAPLTMLECRLGMKTRRVIGPVVRRYEIVHNHGVWDTLARLATSAARRLGVPYVIAPHGMLDPWSLQQSRLKKRLALWVAYRRMLNGAAFIHVLNRDEGSLLAPLGLRARVELIPNGINPEEFATLPPRGEFRRCRPALKDRPYVLFLGRLHHKKGLDYLAEAFAQVIRGGCDAALVVAGPDEGALEPFKMQIDRLGLTDRLLVTGLIYGREKLAALVDADCFCLPSRQEGFSMAVTEAMGCGLPVVISQTCHFPEVAEAGAGFVLPLDAGAFAQAISRILQNAELRRQMGQAGMELVRRRYVWPAIAQLSIEAYCRALVGGAGSAGRN